MLILINKRFILKFNREDLKKKFMKNQPTNKMISKEYEMKTFCSSRIKTKKTKKNAQKFIFEYSSYFF